VFSGRSTGSHAYPWAVNPGDAPGTDRIMVGTGAKSSSDGYAGNTRRPDNLPQALELRCSPPAGLQVRAVLAQLFVDDFQAPAFGSRFTATVNGKRWDALETVLNNITQTGPIGKLITVPVPAELVGDVLASARLVIDDATTGLGDGYAIDFVRIVINPRAASGVVRGTVTDSRTRLPIPGARIAAPTAQAASGNDGGYSLTGLSPGLTVATSSAPGYRPVTRSVDVVVGQVGVLDFQLEPVPVTSRPPTTVPPTAPPTVPPTVPRTIPPSTVPPTRPPPPRIRITTTIPPPATSRPRRTVPATVAPTTPAATVPRPTTPATVPPTAPRTSPPTTRPTPPPTAPSTTVAEAPGKVLPPPPPGSAEPFPARATMLQAGRQSVAPGATVSVPIWIVTPTPLSQLEFVLTFDPAVATIDGGFVGDFLKGASLEADRSVPGRLHARFAMPAPRTGQGKVTTVTFKASGVAGSKTPLRLTVLSASDGTGAVLAVDRIDGEITIGAGGAGPRDCDGDGQITSRDAMCALRMSVKLTPTQTATDMDGDGQVTSRDAVVFLQQTKV
jgi:hypothetical protein